MRPGGEVSRKSTADKTKPRLARHQQQCHRIQERERGNDYQQREQSVGIHSEDSRRQIMELFAYDRFNRFLQVSSISSIGTTLDWPWIDLGPAETYRIGRRRRSTAATPNIVVVDVRVIHSKAWYHKRLASFFSGILLHNSLKTALLSRSAGLLKAFETVSFT